MASKGLFRHFRRREYWGYLVWGIVGVVIAIPEIWAAVDVDGVPWQTISGTVGTGLERDHTWVTLIVVALIAFVAFYTVRYPRSADAAVNPAPRPRRRVAPVKFRRDLRRTRGGGRLTIEKEKQSGDEVGLFGAVYAGLTTTIVIVATSLTAAYSSGNADRFHPSYVLYGLIALFGIALPNIAAFLLAREAPFPTLFTTVSKLERRLGPLFGSFTTFVLLAGLVILLFHIVLYPFPNITQILNPTAPSTASTTSPPPPRTKRLGQVEKTANCHAGGPLPDHACSPGAILVDATLTQICKSGYSKTVRDVSDAKRATIYKAYGIPRAHYGRAYQIDHIVPLGLGGANDTANLWPEAESPAPGYIVKDKLDRRLPQLLCAERPQMSLPMAQRAIARDQRAIARDWTALYQQVYDTTP